MRMIARIVLIVVVVVVIVAVGGYVYVRQSLPKLDGTVAVAGLERPVKITRDGEGVPHIMANSAADAYFGLGYAHAQDRLWQMEASRRIGAGRLSEILGTDAIDFDKFLRTLGVYGHAERTYPNLGAEARTTLDAYSAGVNAFLAAHKGPWPPEFIILSHTPEPWRPADSLVWLKMMAFKLGGNMSRELQRARMARILPPERIVEFLPAFPGDGPVVIPNFAALYEDLPLAPLGALASNFSTQGNGSNNWVVAGRHTATGKPLLANDPHLGLTAPSIWYLAHLKAPGLNVIGATLPGVPMVILGHNGRIAWGFTNTNPDVQDLFIERLVPGSPDEYETPLGRKRFTVREEVIGVSGGEDVSITVRGTRHGPVMSDVFAKAREAAPKGHVLALSWTALRDDDLTFQAGVSTMSAGNWTEFLEGLRDYHTPQQNIVYADVAGNIGMIAPGRVPIRHPDNAVSGLMPVPGWEAIYDWSGFIPFDELPRRYNPEAGKIYTANEKIVAPHYPHFLTYDWEPPYRARRIAELLDGRDKHSVDSFRHLQADSFSLMARDLLPLLADTAPTDEETAQALELLVGWDGDMAVGLAEPLIFVAWMRELTRLVYADDLRGLFSDYWDLKGPFLHNVLTLHGHWCDDVRTEIVENCDQIKARALELAIADLTARYGSSMTRWRWGEAHAARSGHNPFGRVPVLQDIFDITGPAPGGQYTVNRGGHSIGDEDAPFAAVQGPSLRAIYDLDDLERSLFIHSTGQSGNVLSSRYDSFAERWREVGYVAMVTSEASIARRAIGTLTLTPVGDTD